MIRRPWLLAALALGLVLASPAAQGEDDPSPETVEVPDLVQTLVLDGAVEDVWRTCTTAEEAVKWLAPVVEFDLRSGGSFKTNYDKAAGIGGPGTIVHRILAVDAPHLLVARTEAPEGNPFRDVVQHLTGVWRFEPLGPKRTRLVLGSYGWPQTERGARVRAFFERANPTVLKTLASLFPQEEADTATVMQRMRALVGTWEGSLSMQGRAVPIRREIRPGPGGLGYESRTLVGPEGERRLYRHALVWTDAATGRVHFRALDQHGGSVAGELASAGVDELVWDFVDERAQRSLRFRMGPTGADTHRFAVLAKGEDGSFAERFHVVYRRVE